MSRTNEVMFLGDAISAEKALFWGLVDPVDLAASRSDVVGYASRLLEDWRNMMATKSESDADPLVTVMKEGGPFHCRGELPAYLERLRSTGRAAAAAALN